MNIKLMALDLDGTTLNSQNELTERTRNALVQAADLGIEIVPVTGRCFYSLPRELIDLDINHAITSNGAEIRNPQNGEILYKNYIDPLGIEEIKQILFKKELMIEVYVKGRAYIEQSYYHKVKAGQISYRSKEYVLETRVPVRGVIHLLEVHRKHIEKVAVYGEGHCLEMGIKKELSAVGHTHVTSSGTNNIEFMAKGCNKANTLKQLCNKLDVPMSAVMAVGDSHNDLEMLNAVGFSVAMGNAVEDVKAQVDFITGSNDCHGLADVISKILIAGASPNHLISEKQ